MSDMYEDKEFKAYCDKARMAVGSTYGLVAWEAWKASRESIEIELPKLSGMNSSFVEDGIQKTREHNRYNSAISDCRKAIKSLGLKVKS